MRREKAVWKYATVLVVLIIILNPETIQLGLFIDTVGLDIFLLLLEVQALVIISTIFGASIKRIIALTRHFCADRLFLPCWNTPGRNSQSLFFVLPGAATLMHFVVLSAAVGMVISIV